MSGEIIKKASVEELCAHRTRALELYEQAIRTFVEAQSAAKRAAPYGHFHLQNRLLERLSMGFGRGEDTLEDIRKAVDAAVWDSLLRTSQLTSLMDAGRIERYRDQIRKDAPPATAENIRATIASLVGRAEEIFREGLVQTFVRLSPKFRTNDPFRLGERIIFSGIVRYERVRSYETWSWTYHGGGIVGRYIISDVDRIAHILDGRAPPDPNEGLAAAMEAAIREKRQTAETDLWEAKWYKNGNGHLKSKRPDLIEAMNRHIAVYFGDAVASDYRP